MLEARQTGRTDAFDFISDLPPRQAAVDSLGVQGGMERPGIESKNLWRWNGRQVERWPCRLVPFNEAFRRSLQPAEHLQNAVTLRCRSASKIHDG